MGRDSVILERRFIPGGHLLIEEGEVGNCAYLIQSGTVSVYSDDGGKRVELATLGPGRYLVSLR